MWVYIVSEKNCFTVGFFSPKGIWHTDSDWPTREQAIQRCHYLNGGK